MFGENRTLIRQTQAKPCIPESQDPRKIVLLVARTVAHQITALGRLKQGWET